MADGERGLLIILSISIIATNCAATNFKLGFLLAMSDKSQSHFNEGSRYAGAIRVAMNALRNDSRYNHLNFSYIYKVCTR